MIRLLVFGSLLLSGCAAQTLLAANFAALDQELKVAHTRTNCLPEQLAIADANYEFTQLEFKQGDTRRAQDHIDVARQAAAAVVGKCPAVVVLAANDADKDGLMDLEDLCPNEPEDLDGFKDTDGCPEYDNDGDGISDDSDGCRDQAEDLDGFQDADGCPEVDNDRDGVLDTQDECPNTPGSLQAAGCPESDSDGDGFADASDRCPNEPETKNDYLDLDGCPDEKPQRIEITASHIVIKERINFETGKARILTESYEVLDDVVTVLRDYPELQVEIQGHTDNVGDELANQRLSKERADSVFEYLLAHGVLPGRLVTAGYGESRPIDTNTTEEGRLNNRRVEFVIVGR